jgi:putative endonuclease
MKKRYFVLRVRAAHVILNSFSGSLRRTILLEMTVTEHRYFVYLLANRGQMLYAGVTNDLFRRIWQHKNRQVPGFSSKYRIDRLVWFEETNDVRAAIAREKQIKTWRRRWKMNLIEFENPEWVDLAANWYG